ncbi:MAG: HlyC/CorC family transporter [Deltaproteobacteria bacterium]|nr:HlyC/CorC family transporter [Deltaproteobacteria bacterium]
MFHFLLLVFLLSFSAFVSCAETALFSLSRVELHRLKRAADWPSRRLRALLRHPREILVTILIGNEVSNVAISVVAADFVHTVIPSAWEATLIAVALVAPLILVFGEILPKNLAVHTASQIAPMLALPLELFTFITRPVRAILTRLADGAVRLFGGDPSQVRAMIVEEEFRHMVEMGQQAGVLSTSEGDLIHRVFDFGDISVEEVMTPASRMFRLALRQSTEHLLEQVRSAQYSRIPVYADQPDDIVGVLYARDLFSLHAQRLRGLTREVEEIVRPILFVPRTARLEEVLREFQQKKIHLAVVVDAKRKPVGVATMDDILRALFGAKEAA